MEEIHGKPGEQIPQYSHKKVISGFQLAVLITLASFSSVGQGFQEKKLLWNSVSNGTWDN